MRKTLPLHFFLGLMFIFICSSSGRADWPHFLPLPFNDPEVKIKGAGDSSTWKTFEVVPAADGVAVLRTSDSYGDYVTVETVINGTTYYTLYAHLDPSQRKLE